MTKDDKKIAAIEAAAKHSTKPLAALLEYISLTGKTGSFSEVELSELQTEMLSLIPLYRHPANDEFAEYMIFIDPEDMEISMEGYSLPPHIAKMKEAGVASEIIEDTKSRAKKDALEKIDDNLYRQKMSLLEQQHTTAKRLFNQYVSIGIEN